MILSFNPRRFIQGLSIPGMVAGLLLGVSGTGAQAASAVITGDGGWLFPAWESLSKVDNPGTARNIARVKHLQQQTCTPAHRAGCAGGADESAVLCPAPARRSALERRRHAAL